MNSQHPRQTQRKRGKLSLSKCEFCRKDKQKCQPVPRVWPQKCQRCESKDFPCSPNTKKRTRVLDAASSNPGSRPQRPSDHGNRDSRLGQRTPTQDVAFDDGSYPSLTTLSNAVSLYKIFQRGAFRAEKQFQDLARIAEDFDEIEDQNDHIHDAARKLRARLLDILSARLQKLSSPELDGNPSALEPLVINMLIKGLLENFLPIGTHRYSSRASEGSQTRPEIAGLTIDVMEARGEAGSALLMHDESLEELSRSGVAPPTAEQLIEYWRQQDCLGSTVLHSIIEHIGSCCNGAITQVGSTARARLLTNIATENFSAPRPRDNYNRTPLHIAAQWNVVDVAKALLEAGIDPDQQTCSRRTALHYASSLGHIDICQLLLENGADMNAQTKGGNSALMVALLRPDDTYKVFLGHGKMDLNIRNRQGDTALHLAALQGNLAAVKDILPLCGEAVNRQNDAGETPLILAVQSGEKGEATKTVKALLELTEVDPAIPDESGMVALHHATIWGNLEVCKLLGLRMDGGLFLELDGGRRASHLAREKGHEDIAAMLWTLEARMLPSLGSLLPP
ncbi:ankyrin repeat-containing domain protein [Immersiella caudata]|uniref:Ankyrin repeat-containing domain protein n=1 Tax=Immersiella caudata TaxID=314043 RepID=A0AA39WQH3_9PEZI|nr:ankyrin repeat-containing domain protein [Immersiella caudata]